MNKFNWSKKELLAYEQRKTYNGEIAVFAEKFDESIRVGHVKGRQEGRQEGILIGHEKGRKEGEE